MGERRRSLVTQEAAGVEEVPVGRAGRAELLVDGGSDDEDLGQAIVEALGLGQASSLVQQASSPFARIVSSTASCQPVRSSGYSIR